MSLSNPLRFWSALVAIATLSSCATHRPQNSHSVPLLPGMTANETKKPKSSKKTNENREEDASETLGPSSATVPEEDEKVGHFDEPVETGSPEEDEEEVVVRPKRGESPIPHEFNEKVATWIQFFSQRDRERFQVFLDRGEPYREAVENILEENKVPADLYYLGLIESGFNFRASSRVKAVGVWQFMKPTGKMYGLAVDSYLDERRDPIRATEAAARYLRDLYREFKSWYLAMAAYNAGPGRIRSCIRKAKTDDFWELVEKKKLPRETMEYIPKYLAARYIGENPELFAFYINEEKKYPDVELVKVPSPVTFESIEKKSGMPLGTLAFVNPHYKTNFSHPGKSTDEIWVPEKYAKTVEKQFQELSSERIKVKPAKAVATVRDKVVVHVVKRGDTLKSVARARGLSVAYLRRVNNLGRNAKLSPGQKLKLAASNYRQKKEHPRKSQKRRKR